MRKTFLILALLAIASCAFIPFYPTHRRNHTRNHTKPVPSHNETRHVPPHNGTRHHPPHNGTKPVPPHNETRPVPPHNKTKPHHPERNHTRRNETKPHHPERNHTRRNETKPHHPERNHTRRNETHPHHNHTKRNETHPHHPHHNHTHPNHTHPHPHHNHTHPPHHNHTRRNHSEPRFPVFPPFKRNYTYNHTKVNRTKAHLKNKTKTHDKKKEHKEVFLQRKHKPRKTLKEVAEEVNKKKTTWTATVYERDYKPFLGVLKGGEKLPLKNSFKTSKNDLPENFDLREQYPNCESLREVRDQANCGSCWAFGAVEAMSDRVCIASGQTDQRRVSAQNLLTCCSSCGFGCNGGYPSSAWSYWKSTGIVTGGLYGDKTTCQPYFLPECDHHTEGSHGTCPDTVNTPSCVRNCDDGNKGDYSSDLIKGSSAYSVSGEANIMKDIYENGSVEASFTVYDDFLTYKSGVYQHVSGSYLGGHAIKMIGWGVENGVKYWICVNSWNDEWGENGLFRIKRGSNECGIERSVNAGLPKL